MPRRTFVSSKYELCCEMFVQHATADFGAGGAVLDDWLSGAAAYGPRVGL